MDYCESIDKSKWKQQQANIINRRVYAQNVICQENMKTY